MKLKISVALIGIFLISFVPVSAQTTLDRKYVKIIVNGVNSSLDAKAIDLFIKTQAGVITSRMDVRSNVYFGIYQTSSGLELSDFKTWLTDLGYSVKCSVEEIHGKDRVINLKASDCPTTNDSQFTNTIKE